MIHKGKKNIFSLICFMAFFVPLSMFLLASCEKAKGPIPGGVPEVAVVVMKEERVPIITELPGRTSAYMIADVRPQVSGIIQKRLFTEGDNVKAGDVLYQIDPATYEAAYAGARAALARAEANSMSIGNRVKRYKELVEINAVSKQDYDDAVVALKQVEAEIEINKAAAETARINLAYTSVKSPISGRIGKSNVTVGALVTANQPAALAVVQQLDPIYVDASQSSASQLQFKRYIEAGRMKGAGSDQARVKLLLEDGTPYAMEGKLKFSDVTVEPSTGSFIIRMVFPNPKHVLLPGMYVRALIQEGVAEHAILVPQQGVSHDPKGNPVVLIVNAQDQVEQRVIKANRAIDDKWFASSGLAPGDRVIVEGMQKVRPGGSVKVVTFDTDGKDGKKTSDVPKKSSQPAKAN